MGGSPKSRRREQNLLICDSNKGGGGQKSDNFADVIYGSPHSCSDIISEPGKQSGKSDRVLDIDTAALPPLAVVELGRRGERHLWGIC